VILHNKLVDIPVVSQVIKHILGQKSLQVHVNLTIDLPISQGFGMSAANALSTSLALSSILQIPKENAWMAAHRAEIEMKTGLGDVAAQIKGGIEIREKPGIPPWGQIKNIPGSWNIIICSIDSMIQTSEILQNKNIQEKIITLGKKCTDTLLEKPTFQHFFELSQKFTIKTGLAIKSVIEALDAIKPYGMASMSMLGNSVFAIGNTDELINILSSYGMVQRCHVDQQTRWTYYPKK
jgi:pantoate kinase